MLQQFFKVNSLQVLQIILVVVIFFSMLLMSNNITLQTTKLQKLHNNMCNMEQRVSIILQGEKLNHSIIRELMIEVARLKEQNRIQENMNYTFSLVIDEVINRSEGRSY